MQGGRPLVEAASPEGPGWFKPNEEIPCRLPWTKLVLNQRVRLPISWGNGYERGGGLRPVEELAFILLSETLLTRTLENGKRCTKFMDIINYVVLCRYSPFDLI